jgi:hypothetical protein
MDEMSLLGDALKQQSLEKGNSWLNKIKQGLHWVWGYLDNGEGKK